MRLDITSVQSQQYILQQCYELGQKLSELGISRPTHDIPEKIQRKLNLVIDNNNDIFRERMRKIFLRGFDSEDDN